MELEQNWPGGEIEEIASLGEKKVVGVRPGGPSDAWLPLGGTHWRVCNEREV